MKTTLFTLITLLVSLNSISCAQPRTAKDSFEVSDFTAIESSVVANIVITQSDVISVTAEGDEERLNHLIVRMDGDRLIFDVDKRLKKRFGRTPGKLTIHISTPTLTEIDSRGVGDLNIEGTFITPELFILSKGVGNLTANNLESEFMKIQSDGVGNTQVGGKANRVEINSKGVGNVSAQNLTARETKVVSKGIGNVTCHASEALTLDVDGVGNVRYYGDPKTKDFSKDGVGKIKSGD